MSVGSRRSAGVVARHSCRPSLQPSERAEGIPPVHREVATQLRGARPEQFDHRSCLIERISDGGVFVDRHGSTNLTIGFGDQDRERRHLSRVELSQPRQRGCIGRACRADCDRHVQIPWRPRRRLPCRPAQARAVGGAAQVVVVGVCDQLCEVGAGNHWRWPFHLRVRGCRPHRKGRRTRRQSGTDPGLLRRRAPAGPACPKPAGELRARRGGAHAGHQRALPGYRRRASRRRQRGESPPF